MKKEALLKTLAENNIIPSKRLGQNFLIDENIVRFINRTAAPEKDQFILEIGPGLGVLTKYLLDSKADVTAIEFDSRLAEYLKKNINDKNFKIIHADACKVDYDSLTQDIGNYRIISNLPYSISTPLLAKLLEQNNLPEDMVFLLQKEAAQRFVAGPNNKTYGGISIRIQAAYDAKYIRTVSPSVFHPKPEVDSAIVKFTRKNKVPEKRIMDSLSILVKTAFSKRRKKLISNIKNLFTNKDLGEIFESLNIGPNARPENLTPDQYLDLTKIMINQS
ncbi:MAG: ribosomal RNA small subunit methyltransferase A [bacterium]|nr:ribosomal RNA small subunit methyltransferase A [bacterium]